MNMEHKAEGVYEVRQRAFDPAAEDDRDLGPLQQLPGLWKNVEEEGSLTDGRGWNLIALPFVQEGHPPYRLLMNQYNEELRFSFVDDMVPNRGIEFPPLTKDQFLVTLDYQQAIRQTGAADDADTPLAGDAGLPIHHEPGLFLHMKNHRTDDIDVARLATIPHGNSAIAIGKSQSYDGPPQNIETGSSFPEGAVLIGEDVDQEVDNATEVSDYLNPYKKFTDAPFKGIFSAKTPFDTLKGALSLMDVKRTTELRMTTDVKEAGIVNIPFIERQADANLMRSVFYIMELNGPPGPDGKPPMALAYTQFIFLDFFPRRDGEAGLIRWPHISINLMQKVAEPTPADPYMLNA
ncbi:heme-binding protein [bacterium]|nr:heme-binding protein [bacterium]